MKNLLFIVSIILASATGCSTEFQDGADTLPLLPYPQEVARSEGSFIAGETIAFKASGINELTDPVLFDQLRGSVAGTYDLELNMEETTSPDIWFGIPGDDEDFKSLCESESMMPIEKTGEEGYVLKVSPSHILLAANTNKGLFYGLQTLRQLWRGYPGKSGIPCMTVTDWPEIPVRAVMDDVSRGPIPRNAYIKDQIRRYSELKINHMSFYIEHVVQTEKYPGFAPDDGAISIQEFRELSEFAADYHIKLIGSFQSLGHFEKILAVPEFRHLGATDRMLDPLNPVAVDFLRDVYREMAPVFSSEWFTPNCDEAWDLSRAELSGEAASLGVAQIYADHIIRIDTTLRELGKRSLIWGDIILEFPDILNLIPPHILLGAWNYDPLDSFAEFIDPLMNAGFEFTVSPGILNSNRLFPDYRQAMVNIRNFINEGHEKGAAGVYCTVWDDGGPHFFNHDWYGIAYTAEQCWRPNREDMAPFDLRFSRAFYGDFQNSVPVGIQELNKLTELGPTYEMNELIFGKILIPKKGKSISFNLEEWEEVSDLALSASQIFSSGDVTRYTDDIASLQFVCKQYLFLANSRKALLEASSYYKKAVSLGLDENEKAQELIEKARRLVYEQIISFNYLSADFEKLWQMESRPHWYAKATSVYNLRREAFQNQLYLLDKAISGFSDGEPLPPANNIRLDISTHSGQYFQFWLTCGPFPVKSTADFTGDFLVHMGGETAARPYPGMEITDPGGEKIRWHKFDSPYRHEVNLGLACPTESNAIAYAYCTLDSPVDKKTKVSLNYEGGVAVYCNDDLIFENMGAPDDAALDQEFMLPLKEGRNHILLKFEYNSSGQDFAFKLADEEIRNHKQKYFIQ
jgi:hexosaminidase